MNNGRNWWSLIFKEKSGSWEKVGKVPKFGEKCGFFEFAQKLVVKCHVLTFLSESSWRFWFMVANVIIPKNLVQEIWPLFYLTNHRSHPQKGGNIFIRNQIWILQVAINFCCNALLKDSNKTRIFSIPIFLLT